MLYVQHARMDKKIPLGHEIAEIRQYLSFSKENAGVVNVLQQFSQKAQSHGKIQKG